jgi:Cu-Zn family superoxide dismutase
MKIRKLTAMACVAALGGGCVHQSDRNVPHAHAVLHDAGGREVARADLSQGSSGIRIVIQGNGLKPGTAGMHLHMIGRCDPPDFASAGAHWNPTGRQHGRYNPTGMHLGDLQNLKIGADGRTRLSTTAYRASLGDLLDADGAALVIHADADDYRTDPSGKSGARLACGVISPS